VLKENVVEVGDVLFQKLGSAAEAASVLFNNNTFVFPTVEL
jgi:hypothetical protein